MGRLSNQVETTTEAVIQNSTEDSVENIVDSFRNHWAQSFKGNPQAYDSKEIKCLLNQVVSGIAWNGDDRMLILTESNTIEFIVTGDCCSHSYFYDFIGVGNLLGNGEIVEAEVIALNLEDAEYFKKGVLECQMHKNDPETVARVLRVQQALIDMGNKDTVDRYSSEYIQVYGYRLTTVSPKWGRVSSVFSFRNSSNGYYGGSIESRVKGREYFQEELAKKEYGFQMLLGDKVGD